MARGLFAPTPLPLHRPRKGAQSYEVKRNSEATLGVRFPLQYTLNGGTCIRLPKNK